MRRSPEEAVVNEEEIGFGVDSEFDGGEGGIDGGCDAGHGAAVFNLQAIESSFVIFYVGGT